ncbi:MAG: hypothetical protein ICV67_03115 [Thermoleophilia bacterium]|nr:hypothetical protein [Thermoleophilia bacterium]
MLWRSQEMQPDGSGSTFAHSPRRLAHQQWPKGRHEIGRVVYCTSNVKPTPGNPDAPLRQETFINALRASGSVDWVEYGIFIEKVKTRRSHVGTEREGRFSSMQKDRSS